MSRPCPVPAEGAADVTRPQDPDFHRFAVAAPLVLTALVSINRRVAGERNQTMSTELAVAAIGHVSL